MGEYVVGAYLKLELGCDFVDYNVRPPGGGLRGLAEFDVIGFDLRKSIVYLCEVTTHVGGLLYVSNSETIRRVHAKHERQKAYAADRLGGFTHKRYMFWSPVVPVGAVTNGLAEIDGLECVLNSDYAAAVDALRLRARTESQDTGNPFFRSLQILECLRRKGVGCAPVAGSNT